MSDEALDSVFLPYVRAISPAGKWWSAPLSALDEESFRRLVGERLVRARLLVGIVTPREPYRTTGEPPGAEPRAT